MARRRTARSVRTVNTKPIVLDDVGAATLPVGGETVPAAPQSLDGREQLDERRRRWEVERERFERSRRPIPPPAATEKSDAAGSAD
jgi:hypothetical protein